MACAVQAELPRATIGDGGQGEPTLLSFGKQTTESRFPPFDRAELPGSDVAAREQAGVSLRDHDDNRLPRNHHRYDILHAFAHGCSGQTLHLPFTVAGVHPNLLFVGPQQALVVGAFRSGGGRVTGPEPRRHALVEAQLGAILLRPAQARPIPASVDAPHAHHVANRADKPVLGEEQIHGGVGHELLPIPAREVGEHTLPEHRRARGDGPFGEQVVDRGQLLLRPAVHPRELGIVEDLECVVVAEDAIGVGVEEVRLTLKLPRRCPVVVTVEQCHVSAGRSEELRGQRFVVVPVRQRHPQPDPRGPPAPPFVQDRGRAIGGTVVHHDDVEVEVRPLRHDAVDRLADEPFVVVDGDEDADFQLRSVHSRRHAGEPTAAVVLRMPKIHPASDC